MIFAQQTRFGILTLLSTVFLGGCGGQPQGDFPETFDAHGVVTFNGSPLSNAVVTLSPVAPEGKGASGRTDEEGKFTLTTFNPGDGARPGRYRVMISPSELAPGVPSGDHEVELGNPDDTPPAPKAKTSSDLPQKYTSVKTSGLETEIVEGENTLDFNLSK